MKVPKIFALPIDHEIPWLKCTNSSEYYISSNRLLQTVEYICRCMAGLVDIVKHLKIAEADSELPDKYRC
jgi:hypothetical protein